MNRESFMDELRIAVNEYCTCGGRGPHDEGACPACLVWHQMNLSEEQLARRKATLRKLEEGWTVVENEADLAETATFHEPSHLGEEK